MSKLADEIGRMYYQRWTAAQFPAEECPDSYVCGYRAALEEIAVFLNIRIQMPYERPQADEG